VLLGSKGTRGVRRLWGLAHSTEGYQTLADVVRVGVDNGNPPEKVAGPGQFPSPFVEIGQRVPLTEVELFWLGAAKRAFQQFYGALEVALVCQRTSRHQTALGHDFGARRHLPELGPQLFGFLVPVQRPVRIGHDRVLVVAPRQFVVGLELSQRGSPVPKPVKREPEQLP